MVFFYPEDLFKILDSLELPRLPPENTRKGLFSVFVNGHIWIWCWCEVLKWEKVQFKLPRVAADRDLHADLKGLFKDHAILKASDDYFAKKISITKALEKDDEGEQASLD